MKVISNKSFNKLYKHKLKSEIKRVIRNLIDGWGRNSKFNDYIFREIKNNVDTTHLIKHGKTLPYVDFVTAGGFIKFTEFTINKTYENSLGWKVTMCKDETVRTRIIFKKFYIPEIKELIDSGIMI